MKNFEEYTKSGALHRAVGVATREAGSVVRVAGSPATEVMKAKVALQGVSAMSDFSKTLHQRANSGQLGAAIAQSARDSLARSGVIYKPCPAEIAEMQRRTMAARLARPVPELARAA